MWCSMLCVHTRHVEADYGLMLLLQWLTLAWRCRYATVFFGFAWAVQVAVSGNTGTITAFHFANTGHDKGARETRTIGYAKP